VVAKLDIELSEVFFALSNCYGSMKDITSLDILGLVHIENGVLPMGVGSEGRGTQSYLALKVLKVAIEPSDNSAHL
jgi:hypothetical protein